MPNPANLGRARGPTLSVALGLAAVVIVVALMVIGGIPQALSGSGAHPGPFAVPGTGEPTVSATSPSNSSSNSSWQLVSTPVAPPALAGFGMVYDPSIRAVVLFGGCTSGLHFNISCTVTNETWTYSGGAWTQLQLSVAPSPRVQPAMTYDAKTGDVLLFGGASGGPSYLTYNDTWEFNGSAWTRLNPTLSPETGGWGVVMAYDDVLGAVVLFDSGQVYHGGPYLNDTWTFSSGQWTRVLRGTGPSPRGGEAFDYDPALGAAVLFGGNECQNQTGLCPNQGDTWTYANGTWTNESGIGPAPRNAPAFAYDPALNATLMFSGHDAELYYDDVWTYSSSGWTSLASNSFGPSPSEGAGLVYDAADRQVLSFGGYMNIGGPYNGTEIYFNGLWTFGTTAPPSTPSIVSLHASRTVLTVGNETLIVANVESRTPVTFQYTGLPYGCASENSYLLPCTPQQAGNFSILLTVRDTQDHSTEAALGLAVSPSRTGVTNPPPNGPLFGSGSPSLDTYLILGFLVGVGAGGAVAVASIGTRIKDRREGEAMAWEILSTQGGDAERPPP